MQEGHSPGQVPTQAEGVEISGWAADVGNVSTLDAPLLFCEPGMSALGNGIDAVHRTCMSDMSKPK